MFKRGLKSPSWYQRRHIQFVFQTSQDALLYKPTFIAVNLNLRSSMITSQLFIAVVVAAAYIRLASSFQPGSDYDAYKKLNLYNCTGHTRVSNVTNVNAADTLPQVEPCSGRDGWEQWSLFLHGTFPVLLRWRQGVPGPTALSSSPAEFDVLIADVDGTTVQRKVTGCLAYTDGEHVKQIKTGESSLTWDAGATWYNVSVSVDGYRLELDSFS